MTCIVGLVDNGDVYLGADSAGAGGTFIETRLDPKVFLLKNMAIGYTSSFRMGQLLQYALKVPEQGEQSDMQFLVTTFADAVRELFRAYGFLWKQNDREEGGVFLIAYRGCLYSMEADFQIVQHAHAYAACGCGRELALGAMYATQEEENPERRINAALNAAAEFSCAVRGPFRIVKLPKHSEVVDD